MPATKHYYYNNKLDQRFMNIHNHHIFIIVVVIAFIHTIESYILERIQCIYLNNQMFVKLMQSMLERDQLTIVQLLNS